MELCILLGVKTPKDMKMKKIQYLICFLSLCEETQPISAVVGISHLQISSLFWGDGNRVSKVACEKCTLNCVGKVVKLQVMLHILNETFHH